MTIPTTIDLNLSALKSPENIDRVAQITKLASQILFSIEVTPSADAHGLLFRYLDTE